MNETEQAVVRWLRDLAADCPPIIDKFIYGAADAIERGEHKETEV